MDITSKSNITLEFDKVKEELSKYAKFEQSKVLCLRLSPFNDVNKIQKEIELTREAKKILDYAKDTPTEFIADIGKIKSNAAVSYLLEDELNDIAKTMKSSRLLKRFIIDNSDEDFLLKDIAEKLVADKDLEDRIFETFDENLNIRQNATPELKGLYSSLRDTEQNIRDQICHKHHYGRQQTHTHDHRKIPVADSAHCHQAQSRPGKNLLNNDRPAK